MDCDFHKRLKDEAEPQDQGSLFPQPTENPLDRLPDFDGETYEADRDKLRLTGQLRRVFKVMSDGRWHDLVEISDRSEPCTPQSASARLRDFRKRKFGAYEVERRNVEGGQWVYRLRA